MHASKVLEIAPASETFKFSEKEEEVLQYWKQQNAFKTSIELNKHKPRFTFYDGPPFATGLPHYGHLLTGTIKDVVTRFAHQTGHNVERRFGWDCHGLPVEYEIDQALGIKGPDDVAKMGIAAYNAECRKIVQRYSNEWVKIVTRIGRWIDFENDYKTMYPEFMESVWWVFKQLYEKGLVYQGFKVMPYSTACSTPLSNFESGQNYKEVSDPAVTVSFPILKDGQPTKKHLLAWTTTPWTLPSNLALCCNEELDYVEFEEIKTGVIYIALECRLEAILKKNYQNSYKVVNKFKGVELKGLEYEPLFNYYPQFKATGGFKVLTDKYVSSEAGTGIVHQAPFFGEDDYRVCMANGILSKDSELVCPIDAKGVFVDPVSDFRGEYIKDADKNIIKNLRQRGRMFREATVVHSYPFCWRSDTPLIYRTVPSWFIRVESIKEKLLENNTHAYWVPSHVREGRFGNWLKDARDWAVSRNRYWGTPIPLWISDDRQEVVCIGSIDELKNLSNSDVTDLHRENVDKLTIPSKQGKGTLKRVPEVFDCWFESGSMPYAQQHYPFENSKKFEEGFPADFIAEGIDQTRGWFYTLLVVSTALFNKAPFKNLIANGLVLASDGQKMSKRKKNYPDSTEVMGRYSADALRLYLITSPAVRAENLKFREEGVKDVLKDVIIPWYNAYRFFTQNVHVYELENQKKFVPLNFNEACKPSNIMDKWILSFTQSLIKFVRVEMGKYHLYTVVPRLVKFVDNLTNWYVRVNRLRLKGGEDRLDCEFALTTLYQVLLAMTRLMAPFTPFISEILFQNLRNLLNNVDAKENTSVHYQEIPNSIDHMIDVEIERKVQTMQRVIELARVIRDRKTLPLKYPLKTIVIISKDESVGKDVEDLKSYILSELNIRELIFTDDKEKYGVKIRAEADIKTLGARLRGESKKVIDAIKKLDDLSVQEYQNDPKNYLVGGHKLLAGELRLVYLFESSAGDQDKSPEYEAHSDGNIVVLLDVVPDQSLMNEGLAREFINRIQKLRKKSNLVPTDPITVEYFIENSTKPSESEELYNIIKLNHESISSVVRSTMIQRNSKLPTEKCEDEIIRDVQKLKNSDLEILLRVRKC